MKNERKRRWQLGKGLRRLRHGAINAAEIIRAGRLGTPHRTPYDVVHADRLNSIRHYRGVERIDDDALGAPLLLVPPLMVTTEIYDMAPDVSAVSALLGQGIDVWMVDFGVPEHVEGGMSRTLDDHVRAVSNAIDFVRGRTDRDVHLAGYSQGGMFCYQAAAYRRSASIKSLITFGSPVDIHQNLPLPLSEELAEKVFEGLRRVIDKPLGDAEGLPGFLTSFGFKMVSPKKELGQVVDFVTKLHDRKALEKRESRRKFLGGEGFVAWPGPALRTFVDEFIVANRMAAGGFVIDGRTVSLADVSCPILYFVGLTDDIARPAAVRAVRTAAFNADVHEVAVRAGHLGLVVGSKALGLTWPTVMEWIRFQEGAGELPAALAEEEVVEARRAEDIDDEAFDAIELEVGDLVGFATDTIEGAWKRIGRYGEDLVDRLDALRWQIPRLKRLQAIRADTRINSGLALAEQAARIGDQTFFLWRGRAFSYADADRRVEAIAKGLLEVGVRQGERVGVLMRVRPTYLSIVTALNRVGAVAVLLGPDSTRISLDRALAVGEVTRLVTDTDNAAVARATFEGPVLVLGGPYDERRSLPEGVIDMEAIDPDAVTLPDGYEPNPGRARDLAMVLFTAGRGEEPRAAKITNRRWAFSALGAAAGCTLHPGDTVYCVLPLHHAAGILVGVGGALIGGARLAVAPELRVEHFWNEVHRYGATVVFYAGEMCRELVDTPPSPADAHSSVRLFAGSGMRADVWERLTNRFGAGVLEFYASTEGNAVLANASGKKVGALGRPLPGATEMALVAYDFLEQAIVRDEHGRAERARVDAPGLLVARVDSRHPMAGFDGYLDASSTAERVLEGLFAPGDRWFVTGDLMRVDAEGDYWFVDRLTDTIRTAHGPVFTQRVEDALYLDPQVRMVSVYGVHPPEAEHEVVVAAIVPRDRLDVRRLETLATERLEPREVPSFVRVVTEIPLTDGYRPLKRTLAARGLEPGDDELHRLDRSAAEPAAPGEEASRART
jgi:putative long chain acyl-CoA synthase